MRKIIRFLVSGVLFFLFAGGAWALSGTEIMEKAFQRYDGDTSTARIKMVLRDRWDKERERRLMIINKDYGELVKTYLEFTEPDTIEGTKFLSLENEGADATQYLYLPALKKVRRIVSNQKNVRFVNTDFTYEDMQRRFPSKDAHTLLKENVYGGVPCYVVESVPHQGTSQYSRRISWVDKERFVILKVEFFGKKDDLIKEYNAQQLEEIDGIWTVTRTVMRDLKEEHTTLMVLESITYNTEVNDDLFSVYSLELR